MSSAPEKKASPLQLLISDVKKNGFSFGIILFLQFLTYAVFGTENSLVPLMATETFHVPGTSKTLVVLVMYGVFKAVAGLVVAPLNGLIGRQNVHRVGWILFIPNPFMIWFAADWGTVIGSYALLGLSQGFCSCTNNQYVQQLIPNSQGFAVGIYETVSYISLAIFGLIAARIATDEGSNRPGSQQLALGLTLLALIVTIFIPKQELPSAVDKKPLQSSPTPSSPTSAAVTPVKTPFFRMFAETTLLRRVPAVSCLAGVMIQVAVGLAWTLLPLYFKSRGLTDKIVLASITTTFNAIRGVVQMFSGTLSDFLGARIVVTFGFFLTGLSFVLSAAIPRDYPDMTQSGRISLWLGCSALLGLGVGGVYPVMPAMVGKSVTGVDRDVAISTFRFWRELGYALGGGISVTILTGESVATCVIIIGALMFATCIIVALLYGPEKKKEEKPQEPEARPLSPTNTADTEQGADDAHSVA